MHIPNPLGSYALILRDESVSNPRRGELLLDYENYDIYYINKDSAEKMNLAKIIYDKIIAAKLQNTHLQICKDPEISGEEPDLPEIVDRDPNTFYYTILSRI